MMTTNRHGRRRIPTYSRLVVVAVTLTLLILGSQTVGPAAGLDLTEAALGRAGSQQPPEMIGLTLPEARTLIEQRRYPRSTGTFELAVPSAGATGDGLVVKQSPEAGTIVPFRTVVTVVLAPPPPKGRIVPTLLGLTETQAGAAVEEVDLKLAATASSGTGERKVTGQEPLPGTELQVGGVVSVTLRGTGEPRDPVVVPKVVVPKVVVPAVTGLNPQIVKRALSDAELRLRVDPSGTQHEGLSFRQDPQPGSRVTPGTPVTVTFAVAVAAGSEATPAAPWPWLGGAALLALLGLALWSARLLRRSPAPPRVHAPPHPPEISVDPHPDPAPVVSTHPTSPDADLVVRIVPGPDVGSLLLTREPR